MKGKSEKNVAILVKRNKEERWGTKGLWSWCGWMRK
jgi:hypothetical protein